MLHIFFMLKKIILCNIKIKSCPKQLFCCWIFEIYFKNPYCSLVRLQAYCRLLLPNHSHQNFHGVARGGDLVHCRGLELKGLLKGNSYEINSLVTIRYIEKMFDQVKHTRCLIRIES